MFAWRATNRTVQEEHTKEACALLAPAYYILRTRLPGADLDDAVPTKTVPGYLDRYAGDVHNRSVKNKPDGWLLSSHAAKGQRHDNTRVGVRVQHLGPWAVTQAARVST